MSVNRCFLSMKTPEVQLLPIILGILSIKNPQNLKMLGICLQEVGNLSMRCWVYVL